jgi:5-methylcytosine-specific restriction endonuclease McrA
MPKEVYAPKSAIEGFPEWRPQFYTKRRFTNQNYTVRYHALRNSSCSFVNRPEVRKAIFERDGYACILCGAKDRLQIDHIREINEAARLKVPFEGLNAASNLQTLCINCHARKTPDYGQN